MEDDVNAGIVWRSAITCPACGHAETLDMPADSCLYFHHCAACGAHLKPKPGDCCVFCSYGSAPCPPVQREGRCHGA